MTFDEIMNELQSGKYRAVYFLYGEEPYFIDTITNYIAENAIPPEMRTFNQIVMYGKDIKVGDIDNTARRYPMMSERFLVIVKEAQNVRNIDKLMYYVQKPLESTILVINYKKKSIDKRTKFYKELKKNAVILESKKLYENQIPKWIDNFLSKKKLKIHPVASKLLVDYLGNNLEKITNELNKLIINIPGETEITTKHIEENIGISKDYNVFELQNAIINRDILKINRIINYFAANPKENPFVVILSTLYNFFSKVLLVHSLKNPDKFSVAKALAVNPYFSEDYIKAARYFNPSKLMRVFSILHEYDLKSKGIGNSNIPNSELLREMTFKIIH